MTDSEGRQPIIVNVTAGGEYGQPQEMAQVPKAMSPAEQGPSPLIVRVTTPEVGADADGRSAPVIVNVQRASDYIPPEVLDQMTLKVEDRSDGSCYCQSGYGSGHGGVCACQSQSGIGTSLLE